MQHKPKESPPDGRPEPRQHNNRERRDVQVERPPAQLVRPETL
jgi:hypothetical protein